MQDLPQGISSVEEIPDDFEPSSIGLRSRVGSTIRRLYPETIAESDAWLTLAISGCSLEVNLGDGEQLSGFSFHVRGGESAPVVIAHILRTLGLRALDPSSDTGLFDEEAASKSLAKWEAHRDAVLYKHS